MKALSNHPQNASTLYRFLDAMRLRMELWNAISAAGIAVTAVCAAAAPMVAWRAGLGLRDGILMCGIVVLVAVIFLMLASRRGVRIGQVPQGLDVQVEDRERLASAAEFMAEDDPFKRLAVRQTEAWIEAEGQRLEKTGWRRWPIVGAAALLLLILIWLLTPGVGRASRQGTQASRGNDMGKSLVAGVNKVDQKLPVLNVAGSRSVPSNSGAKHGPAGLAAVPSQMNIGGGSGAQSRPGMNGKTVTKNLQGPAKGKLHEQSASLQRGGEGHNGIESPRILGAAQAPPKMKAVAMNAAQARADKASAGREQTVESSAHPAADHAGAAPDVRSDLTEAQNAELEALPPGRREIVVEYFRMMHEQNSQKASQDSEQGATAP